MSVAAMAKDPVVLSDLMGLREAVGRVAHVPPFAIPGVGSEKPHRMPNQGLPLHGMRDCLPSESRGSPGASLF
jgi:hypothetical protein